MGHDFVEMQVSGADLVQWLPSYDDRRAIVAQDGMASVEGFRLTVLLTCEYIFGLRMCDNRSGNATKRPCQDLFGNNSFSEGGALGRQTAYFH